MSKRRANVKAIRKRNERETVVLLLYLISEEVKRSEGADCFLKLGNLSKNRTEYLATTHAWMVLRTYRTNGVK